MLVLGGMNDTHLLSSTQIVRPGQTTQSGPDMTEVVMDHCSTTLQDGSVIVTGGSRMSNPYGSAKTELYNFATGKWRQLKDMKQRRMLHSCTQVWLNSDNLHGDVLSGIVKKTSVLSVVVAGGKIAMSPYSCLSHHRTLC
jgi:hypothetical protein